MASPDARQLAVEFARIADDHRATAVTLFDLRGVSQITDFVVICTGTSDRQMRSLTERVLEYAKKVGERPYGLCGLETGTWIVLDYVDVVLHIFAKPYRDFYDLELLWGDAPRLTWARSESA